MKAAYQLLFVAVLACDATASKVNPIEKVIEMMAELQQKVIADGEAEKKAYEDYVKFCTKTSREKQFEIETLQGEKEGLEADIAKAVSEIDVANQEIETLSASIASDEKDLEEATLIRKKERADFEALDKDLTATIDTLGRARGIIEREMKKYSSAAAASAFLQKPTKGMEMFAEALQSVVEVATVLSEDDQEQLNSMIDEVKSSGSDDDNSQQDNGRDLNAMLQEEENVGAPDPAFYKSKSGGIVDALNDMQEKAEESQADARNKETNLKQNYELLKASLEQKIKQENKELAETKKELAKANENKATAEGELEICVKDLKEAQDYLQKLQQDCMDRATSYELEMTARKEELSAVAQAKKIIEESTGAATSMQYGLEQQQTDLVFVQVRMHNKKPTIQQQVGTRALKRLKSLADEVKSPALMQLATRLSQSLRHGAVLGTKADPFEKVKSMITDMIAKLQKEGEEAASQKEFCDREMSQTEASRDEKQADIQDLTTKIDEAMANSARLKEEVAQLQQELLELAQNQKQMDEMRAQEKATFEQSQSDLQMGLGGVQGALKVLRDYYAQGAANSALIQQNADMVSSMDEAQATTNGQPGGAAAGIIGLLEVVESDFSKNLAQVQAQEQAAIEEYEKISQENQVTKTMKTADVKYKSQESTQLDKFAAEADQDRTGVQQELDAVLEYYEKLKPQCIAKPDTYEEKKARRDAEIAGLKEAHEILAAEG
eukprot:gnl/TRDRNA2_/TRDRNA2_186164_c0_seq1.p1 gnl/TRDRNA2_/TRDRNA2_186164_c0~~gnl/TRDRNA2_/TRDRNA2_186164_c0_seq1.p1  ORF type:complete len:724 (+),score=259.28 gnl/TRDRNA2_/TRDRNA2_186164_c0_seq1:81-2252(+)